MSLAEEMKKLQEIGGATAVPAYDALHAFMRRSRLCTTTGAVHAIEKIMQKFGIEPTAHALALHARQQRELIEMVEGSHTATATKTRPRLKPTRLHKLRIVHQEGDP